MEFTSTKEDMAVISCGGGDCRAEFVLVIDYGDPSLMPLRSPQPVLTQAFCFFRSHDCVDPSLVLVF
jgi:hypothetical protein